MSTSKRNPANRKFAFRFQCWMQLSLVSEKVSLPEPLRIAAQELARSIRDGVENSTALDRFHEETRRLPQNNIGQFERAIQRATYDLGPEPKRRPWQLKPAPLTTIYPWFDLFHASGFRRERALRTLHSAPPSAFLFSILLRRLNDWVPQVRNAASEAVVRVLQIMSPVDVADALWIVLPVEKSWRRMGSSQKQILDNAINLPGVIDSLATKLISANHGPAGMVLRQASRRSSLDEYLPEMANRAVQPAIRSLAYRMLLNGKAVWADGWDWRWVDKSMGLRTKEPRLVERPISKSVNVVATLQAAAQDKAAAVRRVAGDYLIAHRFEIDETCLELARLLAADKVPSVSSRGAFALKNARTTKN